MTTQTGWTADPPFSSFTHTALVINPKSGAKAGALVKARVYQTAVDVGMKVFQPSSVDELIAMIANFPDMALLAIAILGGDGTTDAVMQALRQSYKTSEIPPLAILGGGTMNVLAANLGHRHSPDVLFSHYVNALRKPTPTPHLSLRPLDVNGHLGFVFASGAAVSFLRMYYENSPHPKKAVKLFLELALRGLWKGYDDPQFSKIFRAEKIHLRRFLSEDSHFPFDENRLYESIFASTLPRLTAHVAMFKGTRLGEGDFARMIGIGESGSIRKLTLETLQIATGLRRGLHEGTFREALLEAESATNYSLDGEIWNAEDGLIEVKLGPPFKFLRLA